MNAVFLKILNLSLTASLLILTVLPIRLLLKKAPRWTSFGDKRWATTSDGTETDTSQTVPTDYTGFRLIWADLQQKDYPADDGVFLAEVDSAIPPAIAIPMVGSKALTALGWRLP